MAGLVPVALAAQSTGNGPPLVILHGLFGSGRNWASLTRRLGEHWQVHSLDLRNHGASPWNPAMSYLDMATDLEAFLAGQGLSEATVIGHSMGGKTAMAHALQHSSRIRALVIVDIAPVTYGHSFESFVEAMRGLDLNTISRRAEADAALTHAIPEAGVRAFILQNLVTRDGHLAWRLNLDAIAEHMPEISGFPEDLAGCRYEGPTLFLHGSRSDYVRPQHRNTIQAYFPRAEIDAVADAGHWVHAEQPQAFLDQVSAFLAAHRP